MKIVKSAIIAHDRILLVVEVMYQCSRQALIPYQGHDSRGSMNVILRIESVRGGRQHHTSLLSPVPGVVISWRAARTRSAHPITAAIALSPPAGTTRIFQP